MPAPEGFPEPDDDTAAAFALIAAAEWIELALGGHFEAALARATDADPGIARAALLKAAEKVALVAGEYANDADETPAEAALRLLRGLRGDFGRHGAP